MPHHLFVELASLYTRMQNAYDACAQSAGLTCADCKTNCCTSYFQHHTYIEWLYLWKGIRTLESKQRILVMQRARENVAHAHQSLAMRVQPKIMCPVNEEGRCIIYPYRLMICRLHGTRNHMLTPDNKEHIFPGCVRFTTLFSQNSTVQSPPQVTSDTSMATATSAAAKSAPYSGAKSNLPSHISRAEQAIPTLDRTPFYQQLAKLEIALLKKAKKPMPKVNLTLAEMLCQGVPRL